MSSELILSIQDHAEFRKHMPPLLNNGREYEVNVDYDPKSNTFKVTCWEEKFDWGWYVDETSGIYPNYLHCRILDGCQAVHAMQEAKALEQERANEECQSADDYILDHDGDCDYKGESYTL